MNWHGIKLPLCNHNSFITFLDSIQTKKTTDVPSRILSDIFLSLFRCSFELALANYSIYKFIVWGLLLLWFFRIPLKFKHRKIYNFDLFRDPLLILEGWDSSPNFIFFYGLIVKPPHFQIFFNILKFRFIKLVVINFIFDLRNTLFCRMMWIISSLLVSHRTYIWWIYP